MIIINIVYNLIKNINICKTSEELINNNQYIVEFDAFLKTFNFNDYIMPQTKVPILKINNIYILNYLNLLEYELKKDINEASSILIPLFEIESEISINIDVNFLNCNNVKISKDGFFIFNESFIIENIIKSSYFIYEKKGLFKYEKLNKSISIFIFKDLKTNKLMLYIFR